MAKSRPALARLVEKVERDKSSDCWNFTGALDRDGYGAFRMSDPRRVVKAHRQSYELFVGPIPDGLTIDHLCRNPACVNPEHLEPVTPSENVRRSIPWRDATAPFVAKSHCQRGHPFVESNLRIDNRGRRSCLACHLTRERARSKGRHRKKKR